MSEPKDPLLERVGAPDNKLGMPEGYAERLRRLVSPEALGELQAEQEYQRENPVNGPITLQMHEYIERMKKIAEYWDSPEGQEARSEQQQQYSAALKAAHLKDQT